MMKNFNIGTKGLTLVELLVVIAIIGLLASILFVSVWGVRSRARDARIITAMSQIRAKAEVIKAAENTYDVRCDYDTEMTTLCNDVDAQNTDPGEGAPTFVTSTDAYCSYAALNVDYKGAEDFYCIDKGKAGFCTDCNCISTDIDCDNLR